jgi:EAL domain-containing protein (putative c-di-GMP-specific phosphodiesterase class I)
VTIDPTLTRRSSTHETLPEEYRALAGSAVDVVVLSDFGTGFSSISHLRDLTIAGLKLDMSFTRDQSLVDNHATSLARGLAGLASGLGLATIVEGVETHEQMQVLIAQGWQMGQGALFGLATGSVDPGGDFALGRAT